MIVGSGRYNSLRDIRPNNGSVDLGRDKQMQIGGGKSTFVDASEYLIESSRQSYHGTKNSQHKMATTDSVPVFAEGTFEDQVRVFLPCLSLRLGGAA
jgi:hypothetical protein